MSKSQKEYIEEIKKPAFWISNAFMLIATVVGVYLAANEGFRQAMQFDTIQGDKKNYYLRTSLYNELQTNIAIVEDFLLKVQGGALAQQTSLELNTFIWESMKFSSSTLETPSELLGPIQIFYQQIPDLHRKMGNELGISVATQRMKEQAEKMKQSILPALKQSSDEIRTRLNDLNVQI